jgi:aminopeptidase N
MENWGLMTFREDLLLFNPKSGSAADKQWVAIVVAHELAHQVIGSLRFDDAPEND